MLYEVITEFFKKLKPELVTPAVLFLASEDAPNGAIIEAGAGHYSKVAIVVPEEGADPGVEALAAFCAEIV